MLRLFWRKACNLTNINHCEVNGISYTGYTLKLHVRVIESTSVVREEETTVKSKTGAPNPGQLSFV